MAILNEMKLTINKVNSKKNLGALNVVYQVIRGFVLSLAMLAFASTAWSSQGLRDESVGGTEVTTSRASYSKESIRRQLYSSGGVAVSGTLCPKTVFDTLVPLVHEEAVPSVSALNAMTIEGVERFIEKNSITSIDQLLNFLPTDYRTHFSLVEHTRATGQSNLQWPRIVLFGTDGKFLMNVGTKRDDPKYHLLDVGFMDEATGHWEFSVFDFTGAKPTLIRHDKSCAECHGTSDARPVWGTNLDWPGVFGDNIAEGPQGEALDGKHAERMNQIRSGGGGSPRFDFLIWADKKLKRGAKRKIAHHTFGAELLLSNIAMGTATARGVFIRLKNTKPELYKKTRKALLLAYYLKKGNAYLTQAERESLQQLALQINAQGILLDDLLLALGVNAQEAFSLATLAHREMPQTDWSMGAGDLYDMLMLQVLDDVRKDYTLVENMLTHRQADKGVIDCPNTAKNINDVITFKMLHLFYLTGKEKYDISRVYYPLDNEDIYRRVFLPVSHGLIQYLKQGL